MNRPPGGDEPRRKAELRRAFDGARTYLIGGGAIYLVLWVYGLVIDKASDASFVPLNGADDWLHVVLGATMIVLGLALGQATYRSTAVTTGA